MPERCVLVTVGTTKFDDLIRGVDSVALLETLQRSGYGKLVVQHGSGAYKIRHISPCPLAGFEVQTEEYLPALTSLIAQCSLVISHCGAGSTFEALSLGVPLVVVPNALLMDNHQVELANLLEGEGYLIQCPPSGVQEAVLRIQTATLKPYRPGNIQGIVDAIDALFPR